MVCRVVVYIFIKWARMDFLAACQLVARLAFYACNFWRGIIFHFAINGGYLLAVFIISSLAARSVSNPALNASIFCRNFRVSLS